ncbi:acetyl-CoA C-acetyltransferase [Agromyces intestinalis]|uniref:Acetyl-CoA C-acetyltransferase n=1 Tax=Agromyces intestinalis TaxID=2592652 RepID=A0A5C1YFU5_9MICO|nr:acetyl-CoA C-acetyltransferase [Agromyces intestinalis]QEO14984.1 acetyl-CoA C-acetyltransferase [Agromyces intestinalis]
MTEAFIVATARSPIGRARKGSLVDLRPDDLAAQMVAAALAAVPGLDPARVEDLLIGCGQPAGEQGNNLARIVAVLLELDGVPGTTVNRYCSSSLQTTRMAFHAIKAGEGDVFVSAGVESVTHYDRGAADVTPGVDVRNPRFAESWARTDARAGGEASARPWRDPRDDGALPDPYIAMGQTAENVAELMGVTRAEQDEFAARSQQRAERAIASGFWAREITPVTLPDGRVVDADDGPRAGVTVEALAGLDPVFRADGTVTAGNCCPLNDGAAAVVVVSERIVDELGLQPLARIVSTGVSALSPEIMGLGPVDASRQALTRAGLSIDDIDLVELNEAFAAQVIPSARELGIDPERLNVHGGAIAVGHPFGMTGARITSTLLNGLAATGGRYGLETMCVGGGQGMAMVVERV